jgi:uncharacterized membrane-anchored protein YjiN (DUF445 family)
LGLVTVTRPDATNAVTPPADTAAGTLGPRPDDALRQVQLDRMKRRATGLLALAAGVFTAAGWYEQRYPWLGYIRAMAEASLVGGLADWFAVTALFRRPLGLPIPHTAIVATRKERIGRVLGNFVQSHFLSQPVIAANLRAVHPTARAAKWLSQPENSRRMAQQIASGLAHALQALPDEEVRGLVTQVVTARLRETRAGPALGRTLALVLAEDRHQNLLTEVVRLAAQAVYDNRDLIREQVRRESPWWVPGVVDDRIYERIILGVQGMLREIGVNPYHPLRAAFDIALRDFVDRLQHSPDVMAKAETIKDEWLSEPAVADLSGRLWEATRGAVVRYATETGGAAGKPLERGLTEFGVALLENDVLLAELDEVVIEVAARAVDRYRNEIGDLIARTVAGWDPEATSRRFELAVGRDLQFVRINGTLVGGLVGLAIYALWQLWR